MERNLFTLLESDERLLNSLCDLEECIEKDSIRTNDDEGMFKHIRIDGKYIDSKEFKKCDCLIFYVNDNKVSKIIAFFIEVKKRNPKITEVQEQIQNAIDNINIKFIPHYKDIIVVPILYAKSISSINYRILLSIKIKYRGKPLNIKYLKYKTNLLDAISKKIIAT